MTAQYPVHPDDVEALLKIRRYLIGYRVTNGWDQPELSMRINGSKGTVWDLENSTTWQWRLSRLQSWLMPFDLRLVAELRFPDDETGQLEEAVESDPEVAPMLALARTKGAWPKWQRIYLTSALAVARKVQGISTTRLGEMMGVGRKAIHTWETVSDEVMLPKVLRQARVLGGMIELGWVEDGAED